MILELEILRNSVFDSLCPVLKSGHFQGQLRKIQSYPLQGKLIILWLFLYTSFMDATSLSANVRRDGISHHIPGFSVMVEQEVKWEKGATERVSRIPNLFHHKSKQINKQTDKHSVTHFRKKLSCFKTWKVIRVKFVCLVKQGTAFRMVNGSFR